MPVERKTPFFIVRAIVVPLVVVAHAASAQAPTHQTVRVSAEACAPGKTPSSRDAALRLAQEHAVRLWISGTLEVADTSIFDPLMEYLDTYVASSRLTDIHLRENETCVEAEVYLFEDALRTDVAAAVFNHRTSPPVVAFLFVENDAAANARRFQEFAELGKPIVQSFRDKGFAIVEPAAARGLFGEREMLAALEAGPPALARFAADLGAEAVVSVEGFFSVPSSSTEDGVLKAKARLDLMVVSAADAAMTEKTVAEAEVTAADAPTGLQFALNDALYKLRDKALVAAVLAARGVASDRFELTIGGVRDRAVAEIIARGLEKCSGVSDSRVLSARNGEARLSFRYSGKVGAVVDYLESGLSGQPLKVEQVAGRVMRFRVSG